MRLVKNGRAVYTSNPREITTLRAKGFREEPETAPAPVEPESYGSAPSAD